MHPLSDEKPAHASRDEKSPQELRRIGRPERLSRPSGFPGIGDHS